MLSDAEPVQDVLGPIICPTNPLQCLWERLFFFYFQASLRAKSLKNACFVGAWKERRGREVDLVTQPI